MSMRGKGLSKTAYRQLWQNHINDWLASGLTKKQYAEQHQLNDWQLVDWIRRLATVQTTPPAIIPVHIVQPLTQPANDIQLNFKSHAVLTFSSLPEPTWLAHVIRALHHD
jgi:hypothetical protein